MNFELNGKLYEIYPTQQKTEKFKSREFVIETSKQVGERNITDYVKFQTTGDRCDLLNKYSVGNEVNVHFNIRGNRWEKDGKVSYFTNLEAWKIDGQQTAPLTKAEQEFDNDFASGLPF